MRFGIRGRTGLALIAAAMLCAAAEKPETTIRFIEVEGCHFELDEMVCSYDPPTFGVLMPSGSPPAAPVPVAVVLHDAGSSGSEVLADGRLAGGLLDAGFAVIAPDAEVRRNRRIEFDRIRLLRPGGSVGGLIPGRYSERKFVLEDPPGDTRLLDFSRDRGWYFESTDRAVYDDQRAESTGDGTDYDLIGRDEIAALRLVLDRAATRHGTARRPTVIIGIGHGGSLAWQIACRAPRMADLVAPVGGAYWHELPERCAPGARLLHTHARDSVFWPLEGKGGGERRFRRTAIEDNVAVMTETNACSAHGRIEMRLQGVADLAAWEACAAGSRIEVMLVDGDFAFEDWWMAELLTRVGRAPAAPDAAEPEESVEPTESGPVFRQPGADRGGLFKRPKAPAAE